MKILLSRCLIVVACLFCWSANAHWILLEDESSVSFVSTKNQNISEIHQFKTLQGEFNQEGKLEVKIHLSSIDSGIEIRDTRMREKLFLVDKFPTANLSAQLPEDILNLAKGSSMKAVIPAKLTFMGQDKKMDVSVQVSRGSDNGFIATSTQPILISATTFNLTGGLDILQKLAGLSSIGLSVPVNVNLAFEAH